MLSKFNCNTLGRNAVPFITFSRPLYQAIDPQCVWAVLVQNAWFHYLPNCTSAATSLNSVRVYKSTVQLLDVWQILLD